MESLNINNSNKPKLKYLLLSAVLILCLGVLVWYLFTQPSGNSFQDYTIPGVPYIGIYNHSGELSNLSGDTASAVASILEYWNPEKNNLVGINQAIMSRTGILIGENTVMNLIRNDYGNYKVEKVKIEINEIKKYINPKIKTPLFLFLPIDKDQPLIITYYPATVLIGIKESEQKLVFHNYWLGNNYEVTYDDFNKLQERMRPDERNFYLVIQPKNLKEKIREINQRTTSSYPERTSIMKEAEAMFKNYAIERGANILSLNEVAIDYSLKVINDSNFEFYFPPYSKVRVLYELGELLLKQKDYPNALNYTNKAIELNQDLDKPFKDWPGYEIRSNKPDIIDRISGPYRVLGDIYKGLEDFSKSKEAYEKALEINPFNSGAVRNLQLVELELAKKK